MIEGFIGSLAFIFLLFSFMVVFLAVLTSIFGCIIRWSRTEKMQWLVVYGRRQVQNRWFDSKDDALEWLREGEDAPAAVNVIEMYACTRVDRLCNFKK